MLRGRRMNRACLVAACLVTLSGTASAGYLGLGIGSVPAVSDDAQFQASSRSGRLIAGSRWGRFSLEGALGGFGVSRRESLASEIGDAYQLSVAAKLNLPLGDNFEVFGRFGLARTWLDVEETAFAAEGDGFLVGAGLEYRIDVGVAGASIFADYQVSRADMENDFQGYDLTTRMFTIGATVGF